MGVVKDFLETDETLTKVFFVCFGKKALNTHREVYGRVFA